MKFNTPEETKERLEEFIRRAIIAQESIDFVVEILINAGIDITSYEIESNPREAGVSVYINHGEFAKDELTKEDIQEKLDDFGAEFNVSYTVLYIPIK